LFRLRQLLEEYIPVPHLDDETIFVICAIVIVVLAAFFKTGSSFVPYSTMYPLG
jgi:hypothetical protein